MNAVAISRRLVAEGLDKKFADVFAEGLVTNCEGGDYVSRFMDAGICETAARELVLIISESHSGKFSKSKQ